ncbi:hypothetical protein NC653_039569 [Populus alba x Populus x berolinensis]|uniref:Uncharacterized protein n=1 Tax=Populus alba x Populus x berolinensis TaxID=444605 RepID=A0AAD6PQS0_9ROSI|nr:hypothetical protein NC653_039569 [Populus alba x Populus x berolinensis]
MGRVAHPCHLHWSGMAEENGDANIEKAKDKAWREEKNLALELKFYSPKKSQEYSFARLIEVEVI